MTAYDYTSQRWESGVRGAELRAAEIEKEISILTSPRGLEYLLFLRRESEPQIKLGAALVSRRNELAECRAEIARALSAEHAANYAIALTGYAAAQGGAS